jgi:hypothetical protein
MVMMMIMMIPCFLVLLTTVNSIAIGSVNFVAPPQVVEKLKIWMDFIVIAPFKIFGNAPLLKVADSEVTLEISSNRLSSPFGYVKVDTNIGLNKDDIEFVTSIDKEKGFSFKAYVTSIISLKDKMYPKVTQLNLYKLGDDLSYSLDYTYNVTSNVLSARNRFTIKDVGFVGLKVDTDKRDPFLSLKRIVSPLIEVTPAVYLKSLKPSLSVRRQLPDGSSLDIVYDGKDATVSTIWTDSAINNGGAWVAKVVTSLDSKKSEISLRRIFY